jgi:putative ABC transport system substrate-binding protein
LQGVGAVGLVLAAGCERWPWQAQEAARVPRIGFLGAGSREGRAFLIQGLLQGLREYGYTEGQNISIEYRFSEDRDDRLPELATALVDLNVALIVASGTPASFAAKQATSTIPLVMGGIAADPVETGLIAGLAHPGGNVTGMSMMSPQLGGKRLDLFRAIVPGLARVAVFWNPPNPTYGPVLRELDAAAPTLGIELQRLDVRAPQDFESAFEAATAYPAGRSPRRAQSRTGGDRRDAGPVARPVPRGRLGGRPQSPNGCPRRGPRPPARQDQRADLGERAAAGAC